MGRDTNYEFHSNVRIFVDSCVISILESRFNTDLKEKADVLSIRSSLLNWLDSTYKFYQLLKKNQ